MSSMINSKSKQGWDLVAGSPGLYRDSTILSPRHHRLWRGPVRRREKPGSSRWIRAFAEITKSGTNSPNGVLAIALGVMVVMGIFMSGCASTPKPAPYGAPTRTVSALTSYLPSPYAVPHDVYHEVGPSETLWRISSIYNVDMATIMRVNQLTDPTQIRKGQRLLIPNTYGPRPNIPLYPTTRWTHIVIHHTATDEGSAYSIDTLHQRRGWENGMGYDFLIDNGTRGKASGQIEVGPRWIKQMDGAHTKQGDWNKKAIGIAVVGNYSETGLTDKGFDSLVFLVTTLKKFYNIPDQNIVGHRDVPGAATECPGKFFPWQEFKRRIRMY